VKIEVGDKVLVKRLAFDGKHKIQDKFEEEVYTVTEQPRPDISVFYCKSSIWIREDITSEPLVIGK